MSTLHIVYVTTAAQVTPGPLAQTRQFVREPNRVLHSKSRDIFVYFVESGAKSDSGHLRITVSSSYVNGYLINGKVTHPEPIYVLINV